MKVRVLFLSLFAAGYAVTVNAGFQVVPEIAKMQPLPVTTATAAPASSNTSWTNSPAVPVPLVPTPVAVATPTASASSAPASVQTLPVNVGKSPTLSSAAASSAAGGNAGNFDLLAVQFVGEPAAAIDIRRGFQRDVPLMEALRGIAPTGWTIYLQEAVPKAFEKRKVSWRGGRRWTDVLDIVANEENLTVSVDWEPKKLYVALKPRPVALPTVRTVALGSADTTSITPIAQAWSAPRGSTLRDVVQEWADRAHWTLDWVAKDVNYAIVGPLTYEGDFKDAITGIFRAYEGSEKPLQVLGNTAQMTLQVTEKGKKK